MKIYNLDKTRELSDDEVNLENGYLVADKKLVAHYNAIEAQEAVYKDRVEKLPNGSIQVWKDLVTPAVEALEAYDEYEDIQVYIPYTPEELKEIADKKKEESKKAEIYNISKEMREIEQQFVQNMILGDYGVMALGLDDEPIEDPTLKLRKRYYELYIKLNEITE